MNMQALEKVYQVIQQRAAQPEAGSYTNYLLGKGLDKILKKVGEEAAETIIAAKNGQPQELIGEVADLQYHLLVMMYNAGLTPADLEQELDKRFAKGGFHGRTDRQP
ncbi:phosphoribosyl-ATP pyrophosphatase [Candidatus Termititenax persephonae]|uniref:Phosphoribosyl-ATP pyrophosphatase n=1 Tax=Candidatus Termititenax persephonae TaxID=2218525 RepID=A0A388THY5_9BACT|nr:phosphoribosyl-ATP pyrophosphatase [Candidatus Termititenax persephonae]